MRHLLSLIRRCIEDFDMISAGDKIAVGLSGGKDSVALLCAMSKLRDFYPKKFDIMAITLDMGFEGADFSPLTKLCTELDVEFKLVQTNISHVVFDIRNESNPCSLCAKMRRGLLNDVALANGCKKVALAHHFDDAIETFMLSLTFEGRLYTFMPQTWLDRKMVMQIRPMLYVKESEIIALVSRLGLPVVHNPCPANGHTQREEIKTLLCTLEKKYPGYKNRVFGAIRRFPLRGWETAGGADIIAD